VAVVGGGISGLATAHHLHRTAPDSLAITLIEADQRLGGKVHTRRLLGIPVEAGPDTIGGRPAHLRGLIDDLGLGGAVVAPGTSGSYLWSRGRLRRMPSGALLGLSGRPWPLLRSGLLSPLGVMRAAMDLLLPRRPLPVDPSVGDVVRARFGNQVCERLVEPMLAGAHSGRADELSAPIAIPEIDALARAHRSLYLALLRQRGGPMLSGPAFTTLDGGLGRLVAALTDALADCELRLGTAVRAVERAGDGYRLRLDRGTPLEVDAVVLAVPAYVAADLLAAISPTISDALQGIRYSDIATITLAYPHHAVTRPLDATGFLVPPAEGRLLLGCTWLPAKWPSLAGHAVTPIRCLVGGDAGVSESDDVLARRIHHELVEAMGLAAAPVGAMIHRWPRGIPQYTVGHQERLDRIDNALAALPGLYLTGAAYRGASLASCVAQAQQTASNIVGALIPVQSPEGIRP
jgi:oxygen-dependent protoporphyrinogen oxidase